MRPPPAVGVMEGFSWRDGVKFRKKQRDGVKFRKKQRNGVKMKCRRDREIDASKTSGPLFQENIHL